MSASGLQVSLQVQTQMMRGTSCTAIWILAGNSSSFIVEVRQRAVDERMCVWEVILLVIIVIFVAGQVLQVTAVVLADSLSETFTPPPWKLVSGHLLQSCFSGSASLMCTSTTKLQRESSGDWWI